MRRSSPRGGWAYTLRAHLLVLVLGTLVPALVVTILLVRRVINDNRAAIERQLIDAATSQATRADAELTGTMRVLEALSESEALGTRNLETFLAEATRVQQKQPSWLSVQLHDGDGAPLLSTAQTFGTAPPQTVEPESLGRVIRDRRPTIGTLVQGASGRWGVPVRVPAIRDGALRYVVTAIITPATMAGIIPQDKALSDEWVRGLSDGNGVIVARSRDAERFVGQLGSVSFRTLVNQGGERGVFQNETLEGRVVYSGFARAPLSGWVSGVSVPREVVDASFRASAIALSAFGLLLLGGGSAGAFLIARRISRDISAVSASARAIAGGAQPGLPLAKVAEMEQLSDALAKSARLLDSRQAERDEQLSRADAARAEAEAAARAKDEFLAMLGHELRNPLAPVLTALQLMQLRGDVGGQREREIIERQVRHLVRLVDDLLDVSRLRRGRIELRRERFELRRAVDKAVEMSAPLIASYGHQLTVDVPASGLGVDGDETRLAQVIVNLLNNAAKYQEGAGVIRLTAWYDAGADRVMLSCADQGVGIEGSLLPHIFGLFTQGMRSLDRRGGGLGLGLSVVRTIIELHGGTIQAKSAGVGQGSTFTIALPRVTVPAGDPASGSPGLPATLRHCRVLIVDDNRDAAELLAEVLRRADCDVRVAVDGTEALATMEEFHAGTCILDIGLPGMNGFELARRLRQVRPSRRVHLIAVTGYGQQTDIAASRAAGFDQHLVKPVSADVLIDAIRAGFVA